MNKKELKTLIEDVIENQKRFVDLVYSDNPISRQSGLEAEARVEILRAVVDAINGDCVSLKCYK